MQKTNINPEILQEMLESASNAADKGQSQFFTPLAFGRKCAEALPVNRPHITDLNCGAGHLLQASANQTTVELLGADIDPCRQRPKDLEKAIHSINRITYDVTLLAPMLRELNADMDLFVLNPPWRLFFHRSRLEHLLSSECHAVRNAFTSIEDSGGISRDSIDSTIAALLIALDLSTVYGEGMLIANNATLERLLFAPGAPHGAVAKHIWLHCIVGGNPMTGINDCNFEHEDQFHTGVIYFAREHTIGPKRIEYPVMSEFLKADLKTLRTWRQGAELRSIHNANTEAPRLWEAAKERVGEIHGNKPKVPYNLWLTATGRIRADLSRFELNSKKVNKREADRLFKLRDKRPIELVLQRAQRDELLYVAERAGWRVQPELLAAVHQAVSEYHSARAPLYPLPEIMRLGYLDEQDAIVCKQDFAAIFEQGKSYPIRTQTVKVTRKVKKPNSFTGDLDDLEYTGQDLALYIKHKPLTADAPPDLQAPEACFMDGRLKDDKESKVEIAKQQKGANEATNKIDFSLQDLVEHFEIPEVPDVAAANPAGYQNNLNKLDELETLVAELAA